MSYNIDRLRLIKKKKKIFFKAEIRALDVCLSLYDNGCSKEIKNLFNNFYSKKNNLQKYVCILESICHRNLIVWKRIPVSHVIFFLFRYEISIFVQIKREIKSFVRFVSRALILSHVYKIGSFWEIQSFRLTMTKYSQNNSSYVNA